MLTVYTVEDCCEVCCEIFEFSTEILDYLFILELKMGGLFILSIYSLRDFVSSVGFDGTSISFVGMVFLDLEDASEREGTVY